jgi:hypothetical protein
VSSRTDVDDAEIHGIRLDGEPGNRIRAHEIDRSSGVIGSSEVTTTCPTASSDSPGSKATSIVIEAPAGSMKEVASSTRWNRGASFPSTEMSSIARSEPPTLRIVMAWTATPSASVTAPKSIRAGVTSMPAASGCASLRIAWS